MNEKKALNYIINCVREQKLLKKQPYGYDIYLHGIIRHYVENAEKLIGAKVEDRVKELYPCFYSAAWDLCRRGILNYGVWMKPEMQSPDEKSETGYYVTQFTKTWLVESCSEEMVPTEPERFSEMLKSFGTMVNLGFCERAQMALGFYREHSYPSCCAMCGSAAESMTLALAISKQGAKKETMKIYGSPDGRSKIENLIIEKEEKPVQEEFLAYATLLAHWRGEISQERVSGITRDEAYIALAMLLSFAKFAKSHWPNALATADADNLNKTDAPLSPTRKTPATQHPSLDRHLSL
jgi:hypothetical protein